MAKRLYLGELVTTALEPNYAGVWDTIGFGGRRGMQLVGGSDDGIYYPSGDANVGGSTPQNILIRQYISPPLVGAQAISGSVKGQMGAKEGAAPHNLCRAVVVRVLSGDGITERGVLCSVIEGSLVSEFADGDWWTTYWINRNFPPETVLSEIEAQDGDIIVVEVGYTCFGSLAGSPVAMLTVYDAAENDLPEDESTQISYTGSTPDDYNSWIEFSQDIVFAGGAGYTHIPSGGIEVNGTPLAEFIRENTFIAPGNFEFVGGLDVGGEPEPIFVTLEPYTPTVRGGLAVGGTIYPSALVPTSYIHVEPIIGGVKVGGKPSPTFVVPGSLETGFYEPTVEGGILVGGSPKPTSVRPKTYVAEVSGGIKVLGPYIPAIRFIKPTEITSTTLTSRGGIEVGCDVFPEFNRPAGYIVPADQRFFAALAIGGGGGAVFITPQIYKPLVDGEIVLESQMPESDEVENCDTWVLNGMNYEASIFTNFKFNSYAVFRNVAYGARRDGLFILDGPDDNGEPIHTGMRLVTNFGSAYYKRLRAIKVGSGGPKVRARVAAGDDEGFFDADPDHERIPISRDVQGPIFTIDLQDFEEMSQLEFTPLVLIRK